MAASKTRLATVTFAWTNLLKPWLHSATNTTSLQHSRLLFYFTSKRFHMTGASSDHRKLHLQHTGFRYMPVKQASAALLPDCALASHTRLEASFLRSDASASS